MLKRISFLALAPIIIAMLCAGEPKYDGPNAASFTLPDARSGKPVALDDYQDRKAIVVVFMGTSCPINNAYMQTLAKMAREYEPKRVQFIGINSNRIDTPTEIAAHARKHELPFPVLIDSHGKAADLLQAKRTPEAFILTGGRVRYRGRIDDQFGYDFRRAGPTKRDLIEALDAVLAGKSVPVEQTDVFGCLIGRPAELKKDAAVTYTRDVAAILQKNCQECHRPGQIGPMPLLTYEQAEGWSAMIREVVAQKRMPPWFADPRIGHFKNDRSLSPRDRDTLIAWIDQGCARGDEREMPAAVQFPEGWRVGKPDVIFTMKDEFNVPAEMPDRGIEYKYFIIDTNFTEDKWVERAEARPDATEVVHHIIAFVVPPRNSAEPDPTGPPLLPPIVPESRKATVLCGTAPGDMPTILPTGYAKKIPKGSKIVLQMHYTPNGRAQKDRSKIGLIFAKEPPRYHVHTVPILNYRFQLPPGDGNHEVESWGPHNFTTNVTGFETPARLISFMPHMHLRGKDFTVEVIYPDGKKEMLLSVPKFNFNWQNSYRLATPLDVPIRTVIHCTAHFDNSDKNPNNPDASKLVRWGDQTWQEMMVGWTDFATERK